MVSQNPNIPLGSNSRMENERVLCEKAATGDRKAFEELYTFYYPQLFGSIAYMARSAEDAEEILQDVFIKVWKIRESLLLVRSLQDYLFVMAKRLLFNRLKYEKNRRKVEDEFLGLIGDYALTEENSPEHQLLYRQYRDMAQGIINQLPEFQRAIFLLRTRDENTLDEIAAKMNISRATVKRHLYSAMEQVRHLLKENADWLPFLLLLITY